MVRMEHNLELYTILLICFIFQLAIDFIHEFQFVFFTVYAVDILVNETSCTQMCSVFDCV